MRILCVNDSYNYIENIGKHLDLKYGEEYWASGEAKSLDNEDCYIIPELPNTKCPKSGRRNNLPLYLKDRFILLDGPNERDYMDEILSKIFAIKT